VNYQKYQTRSQTRTISGLSYKSNSDWLDGDINISAPDYVDQNRNQVDTADWYITDDIQEDFSESAAQYLEYKKYSSSQDAQSTSGSDQTPSRMYFNFRGVGLQIN
jgi:hypothetical protein